MRAIRRKYCIRCIEFCLLISLHTCVHVDIYLYIDNKILIQDSVFFCSQNPQDSFKYSQRTLNTLQSEIFTIKP